MASTFPNPLLDLHRQGEAEFQLYDQLEIVSTYGEPQAEYAAIRKGCVLLDLPQRGVLGLSGPDRQPFLNNLITNQVWNAGAKQGLAAGQGVYAFLLNLKGRIVADMNVLEQGDYTLVEMDVRLVEPVRQSFDKYLFAEQVKLESRVGSLHELGLHGPAAREVLAQVIEGELPELENLGSARVRMFERDVIMWRDDVCAVPGYHLIVPTEAAGEVWMQLLERFAPAPEELGKRKLRPAGWAAFNAARVEAGRPIFGIDFDDSVLPAETGQLDRAVSFTKGCYLGQEIVARMHARGQVARRLAGIRMQDDALPLAGEKVFDEQSNEIGVITSSTISPLLSNTAVCLGMLKKPFFETGSTVMVPAEGQMRKGTVVATPFV